MALLGGAAVLLVSGAVPALADSEDGNFTGAQMAAAAAPLEDEANDPIEPVNRFIFGFNEAFYTLFLRPASEIYQFFFPPVIRDAVGNALDNVSGPKILANDLLQGEWMRGWETTERMAVNTTLGLGGLFDPAKDWFGIEKHNEDFGQTLAVWGVPELFYLVLPAFGPSSPRDAVGKLGVDPYFDPLDMYLENTHRGSALWMHKAFGAVDEYGGVMSELDQIKKTSVDYYAAIRSMYRQKREAEIRNGKVGKLPPIPDLGEGEDISTPATTANRPE